MTALAFRSDPPVTAVGVVVPARNEQDRIVRCLTSLRRALAEAPDGVTTAVAVVLDRCTDATAEQVASVVADWPQATILAVPTSRPPDVTRSSCKKHCPTPAFSRKSFKRWPTIATRCNREARSALSKRRCSRLNP